MTTTWVAFPIPETGGELLLADDARLDPFCDLVDGERYGVPLALHPDVSVDGSPWLVLFGAMHGDVVGELGYRLMLGRCLDVSPERMHASQPVPLFDGKRQPLGFLVPAGAERPAGLAVREARAAV